MAPDVLLSMQPRAVPGYVAAGSAFQGNGYWTTTVEDNLLSTRKYFQAVAVGNQVIIVGGARDNGTLLKQVQGFDTVTKINRLLAPMPQPRHSLAAAAVGDTLVVAGGWSSQAAYEVQQPERCALLYNATADAWAQGPCLVQARGAACAVALGDQVYVLGGHGPGGNLLTSVEVWSAASGAWRDAGMTLVPARADMACAALNTTTLAVAGGNSSGTLLADVVALTPAGNHTQRLAPLAQACSGLGLVGLPGGRLLALGGAVRLPTNSTDGQGALAGLRDVAQYVPGVDVWVPKAPMRTQRVGLGAAYLQQGVFAVAGFSYCPPELASYCTTWLITTIDVFYDALLEDVFIQVRDQGGAVDAAAVDAAQRSVVLVQDPRAGVPGFRFAGSLFAGSGYWTRAPTLPTSLSDHQVVSYENRLYIIGGVAGHREEAVPDMTLYDPVLQMYYKLLGMPESRTRAAADVIDGMIYVVGGYNTSGKGAADFPLDTTLVYNIAGNAWSYVGARLPYPRSDMCAAAWGGKLYLAGAPRLDSAIWPWACHAAGGYDDNFTALADALVYDPATDAWTELPDLPTPRGDVGCAVLEGRIAFAGGYWDPTGLGSNAAFRREVEALSPRTGQWATLAPLPEARADLAMAAMPGDRLIVMGGETHAAPNRTVIATHDVFEYLGAYDTWVTKAPMTSSRFRFNAAYADTAVYVFGGAISSVCQPNVTLTYEYASGGECAQYSAEFLYDSDNEDIFYLVKDGTQPATTTNATTPKEANENRIY